MLRSIWVVVILAGLLFFAGFVAVCLCFASEWIVSTLASVTLLAWLVGLLVIVYSREQVRATAKGAVVAGAAYWLLAFGPWFHVNIGTTLLTSRLLAWVESAQPQPPQKININDAYTTVDLGSYVTTTNAIVGSSGLVPVQYAIASPPSPALPSISHFQAAGHWSFVWLFALSGGGLAAWLHRRKVAADAIGDAP